MGSKKPTKLRFNCGVCTEPLLDANALFTSCGHFFCFSPGKRCTSLIVGTPAGKCEQCGQDCDAGTLENKASRYDRQLQTTVFASLPQELQKISNIIAVSMTQPSAFSFRSKKPTSPVLTHVLSRHQFRERHENILRDNAAALVVRNAKLKEEIGGLMQENLSFRSELDKTREALKRATEAVPSTPAGEGSEVTPVDRREPPVTQNYASNRKPPKRHAPAVGREQGRLRRSADVPQAENSTRGAERAYRHSGSPAGRGYPAKYTSKQRPPPQPQREQRPVEQTTRKEGRPPRGKPDASRQRRPTSKPRRDEERRVAQGRLLKNSKAPSSYRGAPNPRKRNASEMHATQPTTKRSKVPPKPPGRSSVLLGKNRSRVGSGAVGSGAVGSYASKYAASSGVRPSGTKDYRSGAPADLSRLSRTYRGRTSSVQPSMKSFGSSWQARVSTVPRPSVTPAQLQPVRKKARPGINPVKGRR